MGIIYYYSHVYLRLLFFAFILQNLVFMGLRYGQWWFTTWGYTTVNPPNYTELMAKSKIGVDAIKVRKA